MMRILRGIFWFLLISGLAISGFRPDRQAPGRVDGDPVDQVHLAWTEDPATSLTVTWHVPQAVTDAYLEYRPIGASTWLTATASIRPAGTVGPLYQANLAGLFANTAYEYRLPGAAGSWSSVYTTTTAPVPGSGGFSMVYVADTGIAGRSDGLASGTTRVLQTIATLKPRLILGGGDYAYFNTDDRYANLDAAIDAWFNQMQPLAAFAPLMPAYGNHEYADGEGYDAWAARFPTPAGFDGQRFYSFDVGDAHFISIYAPVGVISTADLQWLEEDIQAARSAGRTWVIPYLHVAPFSDGGNHSSSFTLRQTLGPLFEKYGIRLVLSAHDQSYERTLPLVDVPASNSPTTNRQTCYQPGDGTIWLKASPGGKLSNVNWNFSQFQTWPAPAYTALRTDKLFHFIQLQFNADQSLTVNSYGVPERGGEPHLVESFDLINQDCTPELDLTPNVIEAHLDAGAPPAQSGFTLSASDASQPQGAVLQSDTTWLSGSCPAGGACTVALDPAGLTPGTYAAWMTASSSGYRAGRLLVVLTVQGDTAQYHLQVSRAPDRSDPQALAGQSLSGNAYVFVEPVEAGIGQVRFFIDQSATHRESSPPYDLEGGDATGLANPLDTTSLPEGTHNISAVIVAQDGSTERASASFQVNNQPPAPPPEYKIFIPVTIVH